MRAVLCKEYGPPESLVLEEVPALIPGAGQVVIRVRAWRLVTEGVDKMAIRLARLFGRHLLAEHGRHQGFEDREGAWHADASDLAVQPGDKRVCGRESAVVVALSA